MALRDKIGHLFNIYEWMPGVNREDTIPLTEIKGENPAGDAVNGMKVNDDGSINAEVKGKTTVKTAVIAIGESLSNEIDFETFSTFAIDMPEGWDIAKLTFQTSNISGGTFKDVYDDSGLEVSVIVDANRVVAIDINALKIASLRYIKIRSGTSAVPVPQSADRSLMVICKS